MKDESGVSEGGLCPLKSGAWRHWAVAAVILCLGPGAALAQKTVKRPARAMGTAISGAAQVDAICDSILDDLNIAIDAHWHKGEYNHIVNLSRIVVAGRPRDPEPYQNAGWLLWSMNRDPEAIALYQQGIEAMPQEAVMYEELGEYYLTHKKDYPQAIKYLEEARKQRGSALLDRHMLAIAYERAGRMNDALRLWTELAKDPNDGAAHFNLDRVRRKMQRSGAPH